MSSELSRIPIARRRHAAALLGLVAVFGICVGVLPWVGETTAGVRAFATAMIIVGVLLALVAWGLLHSTIVDGRRAAEAELDAVLTETANRAGAGCGCGHEHDPDELHITDAEPAGCGRGPADCAHDCASCTLGALRG